jgi:hypothetical protein
MPFELWATVRHSVLEVPRRYIEPPPEQSRATLERDALAEEPQECAGPS